MKSDEKKAKQNCIFEIRPNCSISPKGRLVFFIAVVFMSGLLAIRFWLLGAWLVIPFFILEMSVLGIALYMLARSSRYQETIDIAVDQVTVTAKQGNKQLWRNHFNLHWVEVVLKKNNKSWYPNQLYLRSHGRYVRIGECLTDEDRSGLAKRLKHALNQYRSV